MNESSLTPVKPLQRPEWIDHGHSQGKLSLAGVPLWVNAEEVELALERVAIMTAEGATEYDAQTQALCELNARRRGTGLNYRNVGLATA